MGLLFLKAGDHVGMESKAGLAVFSVLCYLHVSHVIVSCQHSGVRRAALWEACTSGYVIPVCGFKLFLYLCCWCCTARIHAYQERKHVLAGLGNLGTTPARGPAPASALPIPSHRATGAYQGYVL